MDSLIKVCAEHQKEIWHKAAAFRLSRKRGLKLQFFGFESYSGCILCSSPSRFELDKSGDVPTVKIVAASQPPDSERPTTNDNHKHGCQL